MFVMTTIIILLDFDIEYNDVSGVFYVTDNAITGITSSPRVLSCLKSSSADFSRVPVMVDFLTVSGCFTSGNQKCCQKENWCLSVNCLFAFYEIRANVCHQIMKFFQNLGF